MFTPQEILAIKNFCQFVIERPIPMDEDGLVVKDGFLWCGEWETIEILKVMFNGEEYVGDPPPNRLKNNPLWSKEDMIKKAGEYMSSFQRFRATGPEIEEVVIHDCDRGLGVLMATIARPWKKITCVGKSKVKLEGIRIHFKDRMGLPIVIEEDWLSEPASPA